MWSERMPTYKVMTNESLIPNIWMVCRFVNKRCIWILFCRSLLDKTHLLIMWLGNTIQECSPSMEFPPLPTLRGCLRNLGHGSSANSKKELFKWTPQMWAFTWILSKMHYRGTLECAIREPYGYVGLGSMVTHGKECGPRNTSLAMETLICAP